MNSRSNVLSPRRIQNNRKRWDALSEEYNKRQRLLPYVAERSGKALSGKFSRMEVQYQAKKEFITCTGSGGGPISGYIRKMHEYLHDDPQFHPKATYSSLTRVYTRDGQEEGARVYDLSSDSGSSLPPSSSLKDEKRKKKQKRVDEKEEARLKSRDEALDQMKKITERMTERLAEIMSKPIVHHHVESEEKKDFYKKFLEIMEKALK